MGHIRLLLLVLAAVKGGDAIIKSVGVASPILGGQSTFGRVELTAPATQRVVITLLISNSRLPVADVIIGPGQTSQTFVLKTEPVAVPTTLTLTARTPGSPDARTTLTVIPPKLLSLDCEPKSVPGGRYATCKAWMDGPVAAGATPQIALSSSNQQVVSLDQPPTVTVPAGSQWVTFFAYARALPQSASAQISATYAGVTKSSNLAVAPAAISNFGCVVTQGSTENANGHGGCSVVGGDFDDSFSGHPQNVGFAVHLTAPAPWSGYKIPLTFTLGAPPNAIGGEPPPSPFDMSILTNIPMTLEVPPDKDYAFYRFHTSPTASTGVIKVTATDPITHNKYVTELTVQPPKIRDVEFHQTYLTDVPLGGKEVKVEVHFTSPPPSQGIVYDVHYGGTTDIKGPARVSVDSTWYSFKVRVFPCGVNPPCHVWVGLGGHSGAMQVNP